MAAKQRVVAVGAAVVGVFAAYRLTPPLARLDDAYIALHSARVVLAGTDPIFGVPALVGATSPVYVALLTAILSAGITNGDTALRVANALGIVAFGASAWYLGATCDLTLVRRAALVAVALGSGIVIIFNVTNGLETGWAMATLTFAIASARDGRVVQVACAAGVLPFLRPDLAPAALVVLLYAVRGRPRAEQITALGVAAAVAAPWLLWTRIDTGAWVAQTVRAKQLFHAEGCKPWTVKAVSIARAGGLGLAQMFPLSLGIFALGRDRLGRLGLLAMAASASAYFVAYPGALGAPYFRYLTAITVPWLCAGFALGLSQAPPFAAAAVALAVAGVQAVFPHDQTAAFSADVKATAEWVDANTPATAVLLVHDAGGISEYGHRRAVDLVGLKTPSSIDAHARWTWPSCMAERGVAVGHIAQTSGADYFVGLPGWDEYLRPHIAASGFVLTAVRRPPSAGFGYTVYRMEPAHPSRRQ